MTREFRELLNDLSLGGLVGFGLYLLYRRVAAKVRGRVW